LFGLFYEYYLDRFESIDLLIDRRRFVERENFSALPFGFKRRSPFGCLNGFENFLFDGAAHGHSLARMIGETN